jgi:hypothetical protein
LESGLILSNHETAIASSRNHSSSEHILQPYWRGYFDAFVDATDISAVIIRIAGR